MKRRMKARKKRKQRRVYFVLACFRARFCTGSQLEALFNISRENVSCPRRREIPWSDICREK